MSDQPQQINAVVHKITPVQLKPTQDVLLVVPAKSSTISFYVAKIIPGSAAIPGIVGCGKVLDANNKVITPAIEGRAAVAAVPDSFIVVESGSVEMDESEWNSFLTQDDDDYRASIVAKRIGLELI